LPDCGFAWVHARLIVRDWMVVVGCWMLDVRCSMFLLSLRSFSFQVSFRAATFNGRSMALARLEARLKGAVKDRERESHGGPAKAAHDEAGAELLLEGGLRASRLSEAALARLFRGAAPKVVLARWFRQRTAVPLRWVSGRLAVGHYTRLTPAHSPAASTQPAYSPLLFCTEHILPPRFPNYSPIISRHGCRFLVSLKQ
jgi:hypothetical protein